MRLHPASSLTTGFSYPSMTGSDPVTGKVPDDPAKQVDLALDGMEAVLKASGLELANMVFVNPYLTADIPNRVMNQRYARRFEFGNTPARATIEVSSLPGGAHIEYTGVAVRDLTAAPSSAPEKYASQSHRQSLCFCGRYSVLFGQRWLYSGASRRRLRDDDATSTSADYAESPRQS